MRSLSATVRRVGRVGRGGPALLAVLALLALVACVVAYVLLAPTRRETLTGWQPGGEEQAAQTFAADGPVPTRAADLAPPRAAPAPTEMASVFSSSRCADPNDAECAVSSADNGITMTATTCRVLYIDKFASGVALYADSSKKQRLGPLANGAIGVVADAATPARLMPHVGPHFKFETPDRYELPPAKSGSNAFVVHVGNKFLAFDASGAAVLQKNPAALGFAGTSAGTPDMVWMLEAALEGTPERTLRRKSGAMLRLYVATPLRHVTDVCVSARDDRNTMYGLNAKALKHDADASRSIALHTCNFVGEWAKKPIACKNLCERAYPFGDAPRCEWSARVDPVVASGATNAGACCATVQKVDDAIARSDRSKGKTGVPNAELWVKVPYANGEFGGESGGGAPGGTKFVSIPAYATIAIRLSRLGIFSARETVN
jgi:hypothetical protein